jgi:hypothetical protein
MSASGQKGETFQRQGARIDLPNPLLGEWLGFRQMDGKLLEVRLIFGASGACLMLIKFATQVGNYSADGGRLVARINGAISLEGTFAIAGTLLTIQRTGGRVTRLKRY